MRPHGSALSASASQCDEVAAEPRHLFADVRARRRAHDLLRDGGLVGLQLGAQLAHALGEPLLHRRAPLVGRRGDPLDEIGDAASRRWSRSARR